MKTFLKSFFIVVLLFVFSNMNAQVRFGIKGGANLSKMSMKSSGFSLDPKTLVGFHAGLISEIGLSGNLKLQPGVMFSTKGAKFEITILEQTAEMSIAPGVIEVPVNLVYYLGEGKARLCLFAGPYVAYGFTGKTKSEGISEDINFGTSSEDDLKPLDYGANLGAGVSLGSFLITAQYGIGLANLSTITDSDVETKNTVIGISVGYLFGGK
jgi:hypothetical protein